MNNGYGLWKEYENEWFNEWNTLLNAGYAIIFISHSEIKKMKDPRTGAEYEQMYPKGDKRTIDMIIDACDFIGYVKSNGFDEDGNPQMSSVYFRACPAFLAGSRFEYMPDEITPFTAEGVLGAIEQAVALKESETGVAAVSYEDRKQIDAGEYVEYDDAIEKAKGLFQKMLQKDKDKTVAIVENYLGAGGKISATTPKQLEQILMIIDEFEQELDEQ